MMHHDPREMLAARDYQRALDSMKQMDDTPAPTPLNAAMNGPKGSFEKRGKGKKGHLPPALHPFPKTEFVWAVQFQFFDNGPNPGSGKTEHALKLEVYMEPTVNLYKPHWVRAVPLHAPGIVAKWADEKLADGKLTADTAAVYHGAAAWCANQMKNPDMEWAKIGRIGDNRRRDVIYPGQLVLMSREISGPMTTIILAQNGDEAGMVQCERWVHDQHSTKGTGRRKAFGFYDPQKKYYWQKAIEESKYGDKSAKDIMGEWGMI
jgi:hypothetical protein